MNNEKEVMENVEQKQDEQQQGKLVAVERRYYVDSDFNDKLACDFCEWVDRVIEFDELYAEQFPNEDLLPIVITISSRGGSVDSLNQILDALDDVKAPIITEVRGYAYSSAMFLACYGDIRIMGNHARGLYHAILWGSDDNLQGHRENLLESERLMKNIDDMITSRTKLTQKELDKIKREKRDFVYDREYAIEKGIVNFEGNLDDVYSELFPDEEEGVE